MNKISRLNFKGQQIYVGVDVHKKSWSISIFTDAFEQKRVLAFCLYSSPIAKSQRSDLQGCF
jgi:hypothetical protein